MRRLGEILVEHGYTSVGELHTALERSHRHRTSLGTQLLRLGFVIEAQLLEALAEQNNRPQVSREVLQAAPADVRHLLPLEVAQRLRAVVFVRSRKELHVAFSNPRDAAAVDEIQALTGLFVRPFVATDVSLTAALQALAEELTTPEGPVAAQQTSATDLHWQRLWAGTPPSPEELLSLADYTEPPPDSKVMYATYPGLSPVMEPTAVAEVGFLDEEGLEKALLVADSQNAVGEALLAYAAQFLTRLCLFSVFKETIHGWLVSGLGPVLEDVRTFSVGLGEPSLLQQVALTGRSHQGPPPSGEINAAVAACLGDPPSVDMVVMPIRVKDRAVAFLVGDVPGQSTVSVPVADIAVAASVAGVALEMIIMRRKIHKAMTR